MTTANEALVKDVRALMRESLHVKRAAGWADITNQLVRALEESETAHERLQGRVQELESQLDRATFELSTLRAAHAAATERSTVLQAAAGHPIDADTPSVLATILPDLNEAPESAPEARWGAHNRDHNIVPSETPHAR